MSFRTYSDSRLMSGRHAAPRGIGDQPGRGEAPTGRVRPATSSRPEARPSKRARKARASMASRRICSPARRCRCGWSPVAPARVGSRRHAAAVDYLGRYAAAQRRSGFSQAHDRRPCASATTANARPPRPRRVRGRRCECQTCDHRGVELGEHRATSYHGRTGAVRASIRRGGAAYQAASRLPYGASRESRNGTKPRGHSQSIRHNSR